HTGTQYYGVKENINSITMAAYKTAFPNLEIESITVNSNFTNAAIGNLLPANALLYSAGKNHQADVPRDINNTLRKQSPTPGAFERAANLSNNATASDFLSPFNHCTGSSEVKVRIANTGTNN